MIDKFVDKLLNVLHAAREEAAKPTVVRRAIGVVRVSITFFAAFLAFNLVLRVALFWGEPNLRLLSDWRSLAAAGALSGGATPAEAYARTYGEAHSVDQIRRRLAQDLARGDAVIDVATVKLIEARAGQVDARTVPAGVYIAGSAVGPDTLLMAGFSQYFVFPRHGYVLVVPPDGSPAVQAAASVESEFLPESDRESDIYAVITTFNPRAGNYPTIGEPIHDLVLVTADPIITQRAYEALPSAVDRIQRADLPYGLLLRNSNSALACLLLAGGAPRERVDAIRQGILMPLRLPGIELDLWDASAERSVPECTAR